MPGQQTDYPTGADLIRTAITLAHKWHDGQRRKGFGLPYIVHPCDVFTRLVRWGIEDDVTLAAAMLHDVFEMTHITPYTMKIWVGPVVASTVEELSIPGDPHNKVLKRAYMESFGTKSVRALIIKAADRYSNISDFLLTDVVYAAKYFHMADNLFYTLAGRIGEIDDEYGPGVGITALKDIDQLSSQLPL